MKHKTMSIAEYATLRGITPQAVTKQIRNKRAQPGVKNINNYGRFYTLNVNESEIEKKNV